MDPMFLIAVVVSVAALIMIAMNLYLAFRHHQRARATMALHERVDALTKLVSEQVEQNRHLVARLAAYAPDEQKK